MDDEQLAYHATPPAPISWTADQLVRLEHEWRRLQRTYAYHPSVRISPLSGNPPGEYQIELTARTLYIRDDGQLDYIPTPSVHVWLPPGYPHEPPVVRPVEALFHPNVTMEGVAILPPWEPTRTLAELVQQVGALLAYQTYDPWNVWNPAAMDWVNANPGYLPTDPAATFAGNVGGEPLGRICRNGPRTLEQLRGQLNDLVGSSLSPDDPPTADEVRHFAERIRLATGLLLDDDVPDSLRSPAKDLDEWAEALPATTATFENLRQRHLASAAALAAAGKLAEARRALLKELSTFEQMCADLPGADPRFAVTQLPDLAAMQATQTNLRVVTAEAERRLGAATQRLAALSPPPARMAFTHSELLEKRVEAETLRATQAVQEAAEKTRSAVETIQPIVARARDEIAVFERVIGWKEYTALTAKARELVDTVTDWGSEGVQAYFVENEGGAFGPFDFEYRLELGESAVAVRNTGRTTLEVYDVKSGKRLAQTDTGEVTVPLPGGEDGGTFPTTFRMTARCDDLWVQVDYLTRQIGELVMRQVKPLSAPGAASWAAAFYAVLSAPAAVRGFVDDAKRGAQERAALVADLKQLSRFKERLATQYLLERQAEMVPRFLAMRAAANKDLKDSTQRIGEIFGRSQRDVESGMPMIPPKYAKEYEANKAKQENSQMAIDRIDRLLALSAAQIKPRLTTPALYGDDAPPAAKVLPPLGPEPLGRVELLGEFSMHEQITQLERQLGTELRPPHVATAALNAAQARAAQAQAAAEQAAAEMAGGEETGGEEAGVEEAAPEESGAGEVGGGDEPASDAAEAAWSSAGAGEAPAAEPGAEFAADTPMADIDLEEDEAGAIHADPAEHASGAGEAHAAYEEGAEHDAHQDDLIDFGFDPKAPRGQTPPHA